MKKASAVALAFFIFSLGEIRGQVYFDKLYGDSLTPEGIPQSGTIVTIDGYFIMSSKFDGQDDLYCFNISQSGEFINDFYVEETDTISDFGAYMQYHPEVGLVGMSRSKKVGQSTDIAGDIMLTSLSASGNVYWRRKYGLDDRNESPQGFVICSDKGFSIVGQTVNGVSPMDDGQAHLIRIDSLGDQIWEREYGGTNYDAGTSLVQTPDLGFLLLGWTRSFGAGQRDFYLVKTDSLGNQQWQETYGGGGSESGASIIQTSDGNYLMCGGGSDTFGKIIKVTPSGTQIWSKNYNHQGGSGGNYLYKIIELPSGEIVAAGGTNNAAEGDAGWLLKTNSEGNEVWQRKYNKNNNTDLFYSVLLANDGGFLLSGQARNEETNSQDAWLLKVDSVGCPYPNCLVGVDEMEKSKVVVDVWPNPASEVVNVHWHTAHPSTPLRVTFTDMLGRSYSPPAQEVQGVVGPYMQYDVSTFEKGLYLLSIIQGEMKTTLKVVVEH